MTAAVEFSRVLQHASCAYRFGVCYEERAALLDVPEDGEHQVDDAIDDNTREHCPPVVWELARPKV